MVLLLALHSPAGPHLASGMQMFRTQTLSRTYIPSTRTVSVSADYRCLMLGELCDNFAAKTVQAGECTAMLLKGIVMMIFTARDTKG